MESFELHPELELRVKTRKASKGKSYWISVTTSAIKRRKKLNQFFASDIWYEYSSPLDARSTSETKSISLLRFFIEKKKHFSTEFSSFLWIPCKNFSSPCFRKAFWNTKPICDAVRVENESQHGYAHSFSELRERIDKIISKTVDWICTACELLFEFLVSWLFKL